MLGRMNPAEFDNIARVLKPGGLLALHLAALDALRSRHSEFVEERQRFTRARLLQGVALAGFQVDRAIYLNSLLLPVALFKIPGVGAAHPRSAGERG